MPTEISTTASGAGARGRAGQLPFQTDFSAEELSARRAAIMRDMAGGVAVLQGAAELRGFEPFRQHNDFYYLTGVEVPHAYLLLHADKGEAVLYLPPHNPRHEASDGLTLCADDGDFVRSRTGIQAVRPSAQLSGDLAGLRDLWVMRSPAENYRECQDTLRIHRAALATDPLGRPPAEHVHLLARLAELCPDAEFHNLSPLLQRRRLLKSPAEQLLMRYAGLLSAAAFSAVISVARDDIYEYQLAAMSDFVFHTQGARGSSYRAITPTGENIWMMHYWRNNCRLKNGELVLYDHAPDFRYYTSDIGRMFPVNGKFSAVQRELYGFVVEYHQLLLALIKPGRLATEILREAAETMRPRIDRRRWSKEIYRVGALKLMESQRPLSHSVGMAVHDGGRYAAAPLAPGLVFAVDPELVIPEERLYIRVEDTVLVTETGINNLTGTVPVGVHAMEAFIAAHQEDDAMGVITSFEEWAADVGS